MEIQIHHRLKLVLTLALVLASMSVQARAKKERADSLVRLMKAESIEQLVIHGEQYRKAIASTFLHNGTYLISDTALWNVDTKVINAYGHVKVIQDETILTSDKLNYFIDDNLAQFRGTLVQLSNKKRNLLRTRYLDYNTRDSLATFTNGAAMRDEDGQVIESISGTYNTKDKFFTFNDRVNMFSDSMFVKTSKLLYYSETSRAEFPTYIDFWRGGNMLSAERGWYDHGSETVFFNRNVHGLTAEQEMWSDSLYFYKIPGDLLLLGNAQVQDSTRKVAGMADNIYYQDSLDQVTFRRRAAVAMETTQKGQVDTIYMGADTLIYRQIMRGDISSGTVKACETRLADISTDAVTEYRRKAAEEAAAAAAEAMKNNGPTVGAPPKKPGGGPKGAPGDAADDSEDAGAQATGAKGAPGAGPKGAPADAAKGAPPTPPDPAAEQARKDSLFAPLNDAVASIDSLVGVKAPADSLAAVPDSLRAAGDSLAVADSLALADSLSAGAMDVPAPDEEMDMDVAAPADTLPAAPDSLQAPVDSVAAADSLKAPADTLPPFDTTKIGFIYGIRNVRIFREDIQVRCDSMVYCDIDSIARFYMDPVVWNEGNRQYTADSLFILIGGGGPRKASLQSNAFVITEENSVSYDQIKGAEIMAYFDTLDNTLHRFDALGGASAIFYVRENGEFATVNKVESKMLSGLLVDNNIDQVYYFESPKNNAYPVVQFPEADKHLKGFNWRPDERPTGRDDITTMRMRPFERARYLAKPRTEFIQTEIYFPGYMKGILREIALRDSLAKVPRARIDTAALHAADSLADALALGDSLAVADSLRAAADSLAGSLRAAGDSLLAAGDSLAVRDSVAVADSLAGSLRAPVDSLAGGEAVDPLSVPTVDPKQKRKEEQEMRRQLRIARRAAKDAEREARWAELDRRDSLKLAAKEQKKLEKQRAKTLRALQAIQKQDAKDEAKLQKYIERYTKQKEREDARRAKREAAKAPKAEAALPPEQDIYMREAVEAPAETTEEESVQEETVVSKKEPEAGQEMP